MRQILFVSAWLVLAACNDPSHALFTEAQRAMESDDYETAATLYRELTIQAPDSPYAPEAHYELAQIYYLRLRDVDAAKNSLVELLGDYPGSRVDIDARLLLARLYEEDLEDPHRAAKLYRALLAEKLGEDVRRHTLLNIANCHYRLGELDASANAYRLALGLPYHRDTDSAYMRLANLEWLGGSADESLRLLRELERRTSDDDYRHEAMLSEVEVLMSLGRFDAAEERVLAAKEAFAESEDVLEVEARLHAAARRHQSLDGDGEEALLEELQKKIRWGGGRRRSPRR
jgi:outer membrane protein assembly factor BamD (BamD/ComL family)